MSDKKILSIIPGNVDDSHSPRNFMQRQVNELIGVGVNITTSYFSNRLNPFYFIKRLFKLSNQFKNSHVDIVHSNYGTITSLFGLLLSKKLNCKHMVTFHGSDINDTSRSNGTLRSKVAVGISKLVARHSDGIVCVSEAIASKLPLDLSAKVIISQVGINTSLFSYHRDERNKLRAKLGVKENDILVIFNAGKNQPVKREDLFDKFFTQSNFEQIKTFKVGNNLTQEEMPLYLSAADVLVLLSDSEGSPTIVKEALSAQLPVVSLDVGDVKKLIENLEYSRVVDSAEDSLIYILENIKPEVRESFGPNNISFLSMQNKAEEIKIFMENL